jgi:hypothetical protein
MDTATMEFQANDNFTEEDCGVLCEGCDLCEDGQEDGWGESDSDDTYANW